eukprot:SAG31_NODE_2233_length_6136_cov_2.169455_2_plen_73_part_00
MFAEQHKIHGYASVKRIPSGTEDALPGLRRQRVRACYHSVHARHCGSESTAVWILLAETGPTWRPSGPFHCR